jgi:hypothetical protein
MTSTSRDTKPYGQTFRHILPKTLPVSAVEAGAGRRLARGANYPGLRVASAKHALFVARSQ